MFWGLILKANKKYTQILEKPFHLSQAALDASSSDDQPVQVMYSHEDSSYLLCTLQKGVEVNCRLDLNFAEGDKLCFLTKGNGIVHLTGFLIPEEEELNYDLDSEEESETELADLREKLNKNKGKKEDKSNKNDKKKQKVQQPTEDSEEDESDDEDFDLSGLKNEEDDDDDDDDEDDNEEGEEEEDDDDEDEEDDSEDEEDEEEEETVAPPKKQKLDPQQQGGKKKDKQQNGMTNGQEKKKNKENQQQQQQQKQKQQDGKGGQVQKLQGGLMFQDLKVGNGAEAKVGKRIQVYYEGRLKSNNQVFDATKNGPGFKMTLGRGEVIKGWDIGLVGMKVGGKRRVTCPPQLAYGHKGNPPVIPPNSTLVFDVELKNVL